MARSPVDIDYLRSWIGREEKSFEEVSVPLVEKFLATFDLPSHGSSIGRVAPLLVNYCLTQTAVSTRLLDEDGHPKRGDFLPPVRLPFRMWAGSNLAFFGNIKVGDRLLRSSRITDIIVKEGRSGTLCFVKVAHRFGRGGEMLLEEEQNIVYRASKKQAGASEELLIETTPEGTVKRTVAISRTLLFRYSALTFNAHRIHYDHSYATEIEKYPGIVVHGPLQATWLLHFAEELRGKAPSRFSFRGVSPLFDYDEIELHAKENGNGMRLWTARKNGQIGMSAEAHWS